MSRNDDIDWGGLLIFGSLIGNLVQASSQQNTQAELEQKKNAVEHLLNDREALMQNLKNFHQAVESFKVKTTELENINQQLLANIREKDETIFELQSKLSKLETEKAELSIGYAKQLESLVIKLGKSE
ncbi:hypothetical protein [Leptospira sp. 'Mane']|uniref:hypothetical protein n=1 Tax=Leptospira sp. 'Mane' TaxID=3387407 RepID=UPI00398B6977